MAKVAKPFNTISQRFRVGDEVHEQHDLAPHSFDDLKARGFVIADDDQEPEPAEAAGIFDRIKR